MELSGVAFMSAVAVALDSRQVVIPASGDVDYTLPSAAAGHSGGPVPDRVDFILPSGATGAITIIPASPDLIYPGAAGVAITLPTGAGTPGGVFTLTPVRVAGGVSYWTLSHVLPPAKFVTDAAGTQTADAGDLTGAANVTWANTANGAVALTTRTATEMFGDIVGARVGFSYRLRIVSGGNNTVTLTAGSGVTITGTATVATGKFRDFNVTFTSATACTIQDIGGN